jgi:hypothetical protein
MLLQVLPLCNVLLLEARKIFVSTLSCSESNFVMKKKCHGRFVFLLLLSSVVAGFTIDAGAVACVPILLGLPVFGQAFPNLRPGY